MKTYLRIFLLFLVARFALAEEVRYARVALLARVDVSSSEVKVSEEVTYRYLACFLGPKLNQGASFVELRTHPILLASQTQNFSPHSESLPKVVVAGAIVEKIVWVPYAGRGAVSSGDGRGEGYYAIRLRFDGEAPDVFLVKYIYEAVSVGEAEKMSCRYFSENENPDLIPPLLYNDYSYIIEISMGGYRLESLPPLKKAFDRKSLAWNLASSRYVDFTFVRAKSNGGTP